ncbi:Acetyl-coenzyme A synthetase [Labeo rohita]|uniref:Acetyl-coenzyme A synthetase n=1 Tax=Labeo rohita TaxID=84645 RepID=A0ABQ8L3V5_LABRO|nr:Acetyl-coenzyme A synthetase [Labeo rohita]
MPVPSVEMKRGFYSPNFIVPKKGGGLSNRPEGRLFSCLDPSKTQAVPAVCLRRLGLLVQGPPLRHIHVAPRLYKGHGGCPCPSQGTRLGLRVNWEKSKLSPAQSISFLGVELDSVTMTAQVPGAHGILSHGHATGPDAYETGFIPESQDGHGVKMLPRQAGVLYATGMQPQGSGQALGCIGNQLPGVADSASGLEEVPTFSSGQACVDPYRQQSDCGHRLRQVSACHSHYRRTQSGGRFSLTTSLALRQVEAPPSDGRFDQAQNLVLRACALIINPGASSPLAICLWFFRPYSKICLSPFSQSISCPLYEDGPPDCAHCCQESGRSSSPLHQRFVPGIWAGRLSHCPETPAWIRAQVRALRIYIERTQDFRRSEQLFVCFGGQQKGKAVQAKDLPLSFGCNPYGLLGQRLTLPAGSESPLNQGSHCLSSFGK